jgi:hypothetical protein
MIIGGPVGTCMLERVCLWIHKRRVGQNRIYTSYMTVYLAISLPKIPYMHRIYMVLANPTQTQYVGLVRTLYILCTYGIFGRKISTKYVPIYIPPNIRSYMVYTHGSGQL